MFGREANVVEKLINDLLAFLVRQGFPMGGAAWFEVRGRHSGEPRGVVVNPLTHLGRTYLVAPRGETQWVRNLRAAGQGELRGQTWTARELLVAERSPVHRAYLARWSWQVKRWFTADSDPAAHPVFELVPA
ncbi:hypothetical protein HJ590_01175 [Naumannella sp. ID2617S]|nr:hypothetical protein [Naumannella sp. ID2617S]